MPKFLSIHTFPAGSLTAERVVAIADAGQHDAVVRGYRSFHSLAEGRIVWILEAPDKEAVADWCRRVDLPLDGVTQLELEGHVGLIRDAADAKAGQPPTPVNGQ